MPISAVSDNFHRADLAPFDFGGELLLRVVAWDKAGSLAQSHSLTVGVVCSREETYDVKTMPRASRTHAVQARPWVT